MLAMENLQNYNGILEVLSALGSAPVHRLVSRERSGVEMREEK